MKEGFAVAWRDGQATVWSVVDGSGAVPVGRGMAARHCGCGVEIDGVTVHRGSAARVAGTVFSCIEFKSWGDGRQVASLGRMIGASDLTIETMHLIASAGLTREPVLLLGESGSGKELAAEYLGSIAGSMHALNMGAVPPELAEAELFGWVRGAFTGAVENRAGALEAARSGVLFLDEVAEAPAWVQVKLLRALDSRRFRRLGATRDIPLEARVVAATNVDPVQGIADGTLRLDLLERLACHVVRIPPLRSRPADIPCLVNLFSAAILPGLRDSTPRVSPEVMDMLRHWPWPGNVRELRNVVCRVLTVSAEGMSDPSVVAGALEDGRVMKFGVTPPDGAPLISRRQQIEDSRLPRSTYYYRLKRGRIPSDGGPRRAPTCAASKT